MPFHFRGHCWITWGKPEKVTFENCLQWGGSNLVDPAEWPKIRLLNQDFGNNSSIFPRKNSKTQGSLNILQSRPWKITNRIFGIGPNPASSELLSHFSTFRGLGGPRAFPRSQRIWVTTGRFGIFFVLCFRALGGHCLQMLCLPRFGTHANTQNLPHFRACPASVWELSPPQNAYFSWQTRDCQIVPGFALPPVYNSRTPFETSCISICDCAPQAATADFMVACGKRDCVAPPVSRRRMTEAREVERGQTRSWDLGSLHRLTGYKMPPRPKIPQNYRKSNKKNPSPDSPPSKEGQITEKVRKLQYSSNVRNFSVIFPFFSFHVLFRRGLGVQHMQWGLGRLRRPSEFGVEGQLGRHREASRRR